MSKVGQLNDKSEHEILQEDVFVYHGADGMRPDLVPVSGDGRASSDGGGQLESTRRAVIIASNLRVRRISDWVAL